MKKASPQIGVTEEMAPYTPPRLWFESPEWQAALPGLRMYKPAESIVAPALSLSPMMLSRSLNPMFIQDLMQEERMSRVWGN